MRYLQFLRFGDSAPRLGWLDGDKVGLVEGPLFGPHRRLPADLPLASLRLAPPLSPSKIVCVGRNYAEHAREHDAEIPEVPLLFLKPPSAVIGPGDTILLPPQSRQVEHEAELAVVIGRRSRGVTAEESGAAIFGFTAANDVTARDLQNRDGQWTRAKGFDTFCPVGPWIDTAVDPSDLRIICRVNGQVRQLASTRDMIFSVPKLVAFISGIMTLEPGDVILTGTPAGVSPLEAGDNVQVDIENIGKLENSVESPFTGEPDG